MLWQLSLVLCPGSPAKLLVARRGWVWVGPLVWESWNELWSQQQQQQQRKERDYGPVNYGLSFLIFALFARRDHWSCWTGLIRW